MILVTLGTQDKSFQRLLEAIDKQIEKGVIKDEVIVQAGHTKYDSNNMQIFDFMPNCELQKLMKKCDILITHGGVGSITEGLKLGKKVIAVPRLAKYKEHTNDHQLQIIEQFSRRGYLIALKDLNRFASVLKKAEHFVPKPFKSNTQNVITIIEEYIDNI